MRVGALFEDRLAACGRADRELIVAFCRSAQEITQARLAQEMPGADPRSWPLFLFWAAVGASAGAVSASAPLEPDDVAFLDALTAEPPHGAGDER